MGTSSVTYKKWHFDKSGKSNHCDEYETKVDDAGELRKILTAIDMSTVITVEKNRETWLHSDYEVSVDNVTDLGEFVEVEYKGIQVDVDPEEITSSMVQFLKDAGCGKVHRNYLGYPFMALYPDEVEFEEV